MEYTILGKTGVRISKAGFGCHHIRKALLSAPKDGAERVIKSALDQGVNFFDLANVYCVGDSEKVVGRALQGIRKDYLLATKGGKIIPTFSKIANKLSPLGPLVRPLFFEAGHKIQKSIKRNVNFTPEHLSAELDKSLKRLKTDYVDFYLLHCPPIALMENPSMFEWMNEEKKRGRILHTGLSVYFASEGKWAMDRHDFDVIQLPYNLVENEADKEFFPYLGQKNLGIFARAPFMSTKLTTSYIKLHGHLHPKLMEIAEQAKAFNQSVEEYAFKFAARNPHIHNIVFGTGNLSHLRKNLEWLG